MILLYSATSILASNIIIFTFIIIILKYWQYFGEHLYNFEFSWYQVQSHIHIKVYHSMFKFKEEIFLFKISEIFYLEVFILSAWYYLIVYILRDAWKLCTFWYIIQNTKLSFKKKTGVRVKAVRFIGTVHYIYKKLCRGQRNFPLTMSLSVCV